MNRYTQLLEISLAEIAEYSRSEKGMERDSDWYKQISGLIEKASKETDQQRAEEIMDMASWCIVDSGPLGLGFAPSFHAAQEALVKARRQHEIEKHKRPNK